MPKIRLWTIWTLLVQRDTRLLKINNLQLDITHGYGLEYERTIQNARILDQRCSCAKYSAVGVRLTDKSYSKCEVIPMLILVSSQNNRHKSTSVNNYCGTAEKSCKINY